MLEINYRQVQEQKQILSQKMIQSAEILQMDVQELGNYIQNQAMENPLIDMDEMEKGMSGAAEEGKTSADRDQDEFRRKLEWLNRMDEQNRVYYSEDYEESEEREAWNFSEEKNDLQDYVLSQLVMQLKNERDYECMEFLVYSLDDKGYLTDDTEELRLRMKLSEPEMERYLKLLQSAEPAGVGARTLPECLQLQLQRMEDGGLLDDQDFDLLMRLTDSVVALGKRHFTQIAELLRCSVEQVLSGYEVLRKLNPIPGNSFSSRDEMRYVKPDVTVVKFEDYLEVLVNDMNLPRVTVNSYYLNIMKEDSSPETMDYLQNKYKQVQWLQHCIEERTSTLKRVAKEIVAIQKDFFEEKGGQRVPMSLKDVADRLEIHESTVSRTVKNKFLQCAWGVYPLNYFFVKKIAAADGIGEAVTPEVVKQKIQEIVDGENKKKPLSDQKISELLKAMEIAISRRTVAKYRGEMMIADASGRRE